MLKEKTREDVKEITEIMRQLDNTGRTLMKNSGMTLLAYQQMHEKKPEKEKQLV